MSQPNRDNSTIFVDPFSEEIWESTYKNHNDTTIDDTMRRVARFTAMAEVSPEKRQYWEDQFYDMLSGFKCTLGGRIYANAGTDWKGTTLVNCFVGKRVKDPDSLEGILKHLLAQTLTLKSEGGWGENFCAKFSEEIQIVRDNKEILIIMNDVKIGDLVYSSDGNLHPVEDKLTSTKENMIELTLNNGKTLTFTDDHLFLVKRNDENIWVEAKNILEEDELVTI